MSICQSTRMTYYHPERSLKLFLTEKTAAQQNNTPIHVVRTQRGFMNSLYVALTFTALSSSM